MQNIDDNVSVLLNRLGSVTQKVLVRISFLGFPVDGTTQPCGNCSCWLVGLFFHLLFGWLVPSVVAYSLETVGRAQTLRAATVKLKQDIRTCVSSNILMAIMVLLVGSQTVWFGLSLLF